MKRNSEIAAAERRELISLNDKSLYICFHEYHRGDSPSWLIQAVNLRQLLLPSPHPSCCSVNGNTKLLRTVNRLTDHDLPDLPGCAVFGSKILFAGGGLQISSRQVYVFETDPSVDPKPEIKKGCFPSFVNEKYRTLLLVLDDGNLYAIGECPSLPLLSLEEFDPSEGKWSALPAPDPKPSLFQYCMYATVGTSIILSSDPQVLYRFDAAAHRWTKHSTVDPLLSSGGRALVLNCDGDDGGFIMFTYSCLSDWDSIHVYQMSKEYEHLRHIESHQMPDHDQFSPTQHSCHSYTFVHLGGRQVCFVLAYNRWYQVDNYRLTIVVVMFEYAMADKKKNKNKKREEPESNSIGQFNFLATRLIEFDLNGHEEPYQRIHAAMLGAFVVPPPEPVPELLPQNHKADGVGTLFVTSPTKAAAAAHKKSHLNPAAKSFSPSAFNSNIATYNHYITETGMDGSQILQLPSVGRMVAPTSTLGYAHQYQYQYQYPYPFLTGTYPNSHSQAVFGHMGSWEPTLGFGIHGGNKGSQFLQQPTVGQMVAPTRTVRYVDQYQYPSQTAPYPNSHPQAIVGHMGTWASTLGYAPLQVGPAYPTSQTEAHLGHYSHDFCYPTFYQRYS